MARCTSAAATAESTPPDSPQTARPSPICARIRSVCSSTTPRMVQSGRQPAAVRNRFSMTMPCSVCRTSGWNCRPNSRWSASSAAATGVPSVLAVTVKPGGGATQASPCDIHTCWWLGSPSSSTPGFSARCSAVAPYSPEPVWLTSPPRSRTMSWNP